MNTVFSKWEKDIGRTLNPNEKKIIKKLISEKFINEKIKQLAFNANIKNLYIGKLTELEGNCLFESLNYFGIGNNIEDLRNSLASFMFLFKNYNNLFPNIHDSLETLFKQINDIEIVFSRNGKERIFYTYNYDIMCQDLCNSTSWNMLPTQLILMVISYIYKVEICIINSQSDYVSNIKTHNFNTDKKIFLGQLDELHYFPLDDTDKGVPSYNKCKNEYDKWISAVKN